MLGQGSGDDFLFFCLFGFWGVNLDKVLKGIVMDAVLIQ